MAGADYRIEVISNHAALSSLEIDWNRLSESRQGAQCIRDFWLVPSLERAHVTR